MTSEAPQVDLTSTEVGGTVATAELTNLPSGNRNFTSFVALLPGVVYNPTTDSSSDNVTINGQHGSGVVFLMDGASNNDDLRGGSAGAQARTPLEAIQEFQVVTNQFDAAYGGATAGVINAVSKQGTNAIRGSAFGYFTNAGSDRQGLLRRAAGSREARGAAQAVGRHRRRSHRPRQDALLRQLRALGPRRGPQPRLSDPARQELHRHAADQLLQLPCGASTIR